MLDLTFEPERIKRAQESIRKRVVIAPYTGKIEFIGGCDVAFGEKYAYGVCVVMKEGEVVEEVWVRTPIDFQYIPGFFFLREAKPVLLAWKKLLVKPDVLIIDGHGIAHPEGAGLASHTGVVLGVPVIGCAKNLLVGEYEPPGEERGSWSPVFYKGKKVGEAVRTRDGVKPVFVSPGHRIDFEASRRIVLKTSKYRIPEPLRLADIESKKKKRIFTS
ncbi:endonuclease V [bacterium]|nr:MAG: endonuclease V [bacterium]